MLTESFLASTLGSNLIAASSSIPKDVGIFVHEYQPLAKIRQTAKKSSTYANCTAFNTSHIFTAQADKAIIQIYSRENGKQDPHFGIVAFPERTTSLVRIGREDGACILALGTEGGSLKLWELATGRTALSSASHLQPITCLAVDSSFNFLLSGSPDSDVQVWSIPGLLSFGEFGQAEEGQYSKTSPLRTLGNHRGAINGIVVGHSLTTADFAVSASEDKTCIVWDYRAGIALHTFLLVDTPLCLAIDPVDRGFYAGLPDGGVQAINFHEDYQSSHPIYNSRLSGTPTQPPDSSKWMTQDNAKSKTLSLSVSYDGTTVLSGHENGKVLAWNVGDGRHYTRKIADLVAAVTNLEMLPIQGMPGSDKATLRLQSIVKPRQAGIGVDRGPGSGDIPENYTFQAQFQKSLALPQFSRDHDGLDPLMADFDVALAHPSLPPEMIEECIAAMAAPPTAGISSASVDDDGTLQGEVTRLKTRLGEAEKSEKSHVKEMAEVKDELRKRDAAERLKRKVKSLQRMRRARREEQERKRFMGEHVNGIHDEEMAEPDVSSDTDELTDSN